MTANLQFIETMPPYRRYNMPSLALAGSATGTIRQTIGDDFLWLGTTYTSTGAFDISFYDEGGNEYIPAGNRKVRHELILGNGQRPFYFPAPRLLKKNSVIKAEVTDTSTASNTIRITLIGMLIGKQAVDIWGSPHMGYQAFTNEADSSGNSWWTIAANSYETKQIELIQSWDFAWGSLTGYCSDGTNLEMKITDPMGCTRDQTITIAGYPFDNERGPFNSLVGVAQYPHWLLAPYVWLAEGQLTIEFTNPTGADIDVSLVFHGGKVPRNTAMMNKVIEWMNRTAVRNAR